MAIDKQHLGGIRYRDSEWIGDTLGKYKQSINDDIATFRKLFRNNANGRFQQVAFFRSLRLWFVLRLYGVLNICKSMFDVVLRLPKPLSGTMSC